MTASGPHPDDGQEMTQVVGQVGDVGSEIFSSLPSDNPCGRLVHMGLTGIWNCERQIYHDGPCWAVASIEA